MSEMCKMIKNKVAERLWSQGQRPKDRTMFVPSTGSRRDFDHVEWYNNCLCKQYECNLKFFWWQGEGDWRVILCVTTTETNFAFTELIPLISNWLVLDISFLWLMSKFGSHFYHIYSTK